MPKRYEWHHASAQMVISQPAGGLIYILERARKRSRKLVASAMPEHDGVDIRIPYRTVPLDIRRAAQAHFNPDRGR